MQDQNYLRLYVQLVYQFNTPEFLICNALDILNSYKSVNIFNTPKKFQLYDNIQVANQGRCKVTHRLVKRSRQNCQLPSIL